jgi:integrase
MRAKLTDRNIRRKPPSSGTLEIWDAVTPGLALRIHAGGKRSYCVTTRLGPNGRQIRRTIGSTDSHKLSEAREAARAVLRDAARGVDSASREEKMKAARAARIEAERAKANSFRNVVEHYLADPGKDGAAKLKSRKLIEQRFENHVLPRFGDWPIAEIGRRDIKGLLQEMVIAEKPIAANRLLGNLKTLFRWAAENELIEMSPIADLRKPAAENSRDRILEDSELVAIWRGCEKLYPAQGGAIRFMLLTGARRTEAAGLRRSEIKGDQWLLPAERSKNGRAHIVHLAPLALEVIASVPEIDGGDRFFTLDGRSSISGWSKVKIRLDEIIAEDCAEPLVHWVFHDLRRTLVTGMIEHLGIAPHVVEATVNHISGQAKAGVAGVYNRSVLLPQRSEALEAWAQRIAGIISGAEPAANVTNLKRRAS